MLEQAYYDMMVADFKIAIWIKAEEHESGAIDEGRRLITMLERNIGEYRQRVSEMDAGLASLPR